MTRSDVAPAPELTRHATIPARAIRLADGQMWGLALPAPRYRPEVVAGFDPLGRPRESIRLVARWGYPWTIERLVAELRSACALAGTDATSANRRFDALMSLGVALLRRAHDLSRDDAIALLDLDGEKLAVLVDAILEIIASVVAEVPPVGNLSPNGGGDAFLTR